MRKGRNRSSPRESRGCMGKVFIRNSMRHTQESGKSFVPLLSVSDHVNHRFMTYTWTANVRKHDETMSILHAGMEANLSRSVSLPPRLPLYLHTASSLQSHTPRPKSSKRNTKTSMSHSTGSSPPSRSDSSERLAVTFLAFHPHSRWCSIWTDRFHRLFWAQKRQRHYIGRMPLRI